MPKFEAQWSYSEVFEADDLEAARLAAQAKMSDLREEISLGGCERQAFFLKMTVGPERPEDDAVDDRSALRTHGIDLRAVVGEWHDEEGWGVIRSDQTPGGCWSHFSHVVGDGYKTLKPGQSVTLEWESTSGQDGYLHRAVAVAPN